MSALQAWCNGYEVIAATSEAEAIDVLLHPRSKGAPQYDGADEDEVEGDGWQVLAEDKPILEEDGTPSGETVGDALRACNGVPGYLWSIDV